jgi:hypothetical protein
MEQKRQSLDELLASVPREVEPPARLWRRVAAGIADRQNSWKYIALAASVSCVLLASALVWAVLHRNAPPEHQVLAAAAAAAAAAPGTPRSPSFTEPSDAKYTLTRATLEATFRERVAQLDPKTRAQIEASLVVIQHAHEDIRKALAAEPSNPVLEQLFESTWHDEIDLYDHVVRATQPNLART